MEIGYLYAGDKEFKPCSEKCKRCTNGEDCQICGDKDDPSKELYLLFEEGSGKDSCVESCYVSDKRYLKGEENGQKKCIQCPAEKPYIVARNNKAGECTACESKTGYVFSSPHRVCFPCFEGCSECSLATRECMTCQDDGMYVQINGKACAVDCGPGESKDESSSPKRCIGCQVEDCEICDSAGECAKCKKGFFSIHEGSNPASCSQCKSSCEDCNSLDSCNICKDRST